LIKRHAQLNPKRSVGGMKDLKVKGLNKSEPLLKFRLHPMAQQNSCESYYNPLLRICSTSENKSFVRSNKIIKANTQKYINSSLMKKQILKELMEINKIPVNYFLLGKDYVSSQVNLDIENVVELVDISFNPIGDIIIKPIETAHVRLDSKEYNDSVQIKKLDIISRKNKKRLLSIKKTLQPTTDIESKKNCNEFALEHNFINIAKATKAQDNTKSTIQNKESVVKDNKVKKSHVQSDTIKPRKLLDVSAEGDMKKKVSRSGTEIYHEADKYLENYHINVIFKTINEVLALTNKLKVKYKMEIQKQLINKCKKLDITFDKRLIETPEYFKSKEGVLMLKNKLLDVMYNELNKDNKYIGEHIKSPKYFIGNGNNPILVKGIFKQRYWWNSTDIMENANLIWTQWKKQRILNLMNSAQAEHKEGIIRLHNHVEGNEHLGDKKAIFYNMKKYYESINKDPFEVLPLTFHIKEGKDDKEYQKFLEAYKELESKGESIWIIKPGENSNRGKGISIIRSLSEVEKLISKQRKHTYILQKYIEHPLLFNKRKFDIRCYGLLTAINGCVKGYFYKEGYLRTASKDFSLKSINSKIVHLTNEAIQMRYEDFGRYEPGNKLTYSDLQHYLDSNYPNINFYDHLLPQIKCLIIDTFRATHGKLDPIQRHHTFEIFGYDFMIDANFRVYLIEVNINPCLEITSPVTARIIPLMIDNVLRIAVDPIFQPPGEFFTSRKIAGEVLPEIRHELVYDSVIDEKN